jgi:hypothetical protein
MLYMIRTLSDKSVRYEVLEITWWLGWWNGNKQSTANLSGLASADHLELDLDPNNDLQVRSMKPGAMRYGQTPARDTACDNVMNLNRGTTET